MSKKAIEEISTELELFRNKLSTLQTTVSYLQNAKEIAGGAIKAIEKTDQNFNIRIAELKHAYFKVVEYEKTINELVLRIQDVNFPERLDKIETSLNKTLVDLGATKDVFVEELLKVTTEIHAVVGKIDEFIINYQGILDEQIRGLKNEIESLRKYLQELDFKGIFTSAKTELIDALNAKTEILLEKLGGLGMAIKSLAEQTDTIQKLCAKEFPALAEKLDQEAAKINLNVQSVQSDTKKIIKTIDEINFPAQFNSILEELDGIKGGVGYLQNELKIISKQLDGVQNGIITLISGQNENHKVLHSIEQKISAMELRNNELITQTSNNQKAQRLQFIILLIVVIVFGIVLLLK